MDAVACDPTKTSSLLLRRLPASIEGSRLQLGRYWTVFEHAERPAQEIKGKSLLAYSLYGSKMPVIFPRSTKTQNALLGKPPGKLPGPSRKRPAN